MGGQPIVALDYDGVFVDNLGSAFRRLLRIEKPWNQNLPIDICKGIGFQVLKSWPFSYLAGTDIGTVEPRKEALGIFEKAQAAGARLVLITYNPRLDLRRFEQDVAAKYGLTVEAVHIKNPLKKGLTLSAMANGSRVLLVEDDASIALHAAKNGVQSIVVGEGHSRLGSKVASKISKNVHRARSWSEAPAIVSRFLSLEGEFSQQKQKSLAR